MAECQLFGEQCHCRQTMDRTCNEIISLSLVKKCNPKKTFEDYFFTRKDICGWNTFCSETFFIIEFCFTQIF